MCGNKFENKNEFVKQYRILNIRFLDAQDFRSHSWVLREQQRNEWTLWTLKEDWVSVAVEEPSKKKRKTIACDIERGRAH